MNKVICNVCGTSYPENAAQCPICGFAHSPESMNTSALDSTEATYIHVKGGRYSKANVKKRNLANKNLANENSVTTVAAPKRNQRSKFIIVAVILFIAIIIAAAYIALRFFVPNDFLFEGLDNLVPHTVAEEAVATTDTVPTVPEEEETEAAVRECSAVTLSEDQVALTSLGQTFELLMTLDPVDTTDAVTIVSSDPAVVSVDSNGIITANAEGNAVITVTCGNASARCSVTCTTDTIPSEPNASESDNIIMLNRKEITFNMEGQSWILYNGGAVSASDITWSSDNDAVATILNGKVVAVADGDTTVHGSYNDQTVSCIIHCNFDDAAVESGNGGISEANGETARTYKLHNPIGLADDVTIHVGEQFPLMLVDENENKISGAQWSVGNTNCCSYENETVKGMAIGTTEITATYEGATYTCVVRVIE